MGLFSKKPKKNKVYSLQEAKSFIGQGYSVVQEENGYRVIPEKTAREEIDRYKNQMKERERFDFNYKVGYTPMPMETNGNVKYTNRAYEEER